MKDNNIENIFSVVFPFWNKIELIDRQELSIKSEVLTFSPYYKVHNKTSNFTGIMVVKSGTLRAFIEGQKNKEITLYHLRAPQVCIFSAAKLARSINIDINIETITQTELIRIPTELYLYLDNKYTEMRKFTDDIVSTRIKDVMWLMEQVVFLSMDKRLLNCLFKHYKLHNSTKVKITHEELANDIGSAREVISRLLKYLERDNYIKILRGSIELTNKFLDYFKNNN